MIFPIWAHSKALHTQVAVDYIYTMMSEANFPNNFPTEPNTQLTKLFLEWYGNTEDKAEYILQLRGIMI